MLKASVCLDNLLKFSNPFLVADWRLMISCCLLTCSWKYSVVAWFHCSVLFFVSKVSSSGPLSIVAPSLFTNVSDSTRQEKNAQIERGGSDGTDCDFAYRCIYIVPFAWFYSKTLHGTKNSIWEMKKTALSGFSLYSIPSTRLLLWQLVNFFLMSAVYCAGLTRSVSRFSDSFPCSYLKECAGTVQKSVRAGLCSTTWV